MTDETAQSNPDPALGKVRTPRALPGTGETPPPSGPDPALVSRRSSPGEAIGLADARTLVASPLWPRIRAFLWNFASLCDPARLTAAFEAPSSNDEEQAEGAGDPLVTRHSSLVTAEGLLGSPRLARAAEQALGLVPFFHSFPAAGASRLLLLSREDYDRRSQFLGVVALAPALRRVTAGADVRTLKAALPDYRETLAYAAYFHRFEALFKRFEAADPPTDPAADNSAFSIQHSALPAAVLAAGHRLLASALSDLPPELLLRQRLRFPAGSPADQALGADDSSLVTRHSSLAGDALAAAKLALKLSNPQEYTTCFS